MLRPILILHAPDAEEEASELCFRLRELEYEIVTYYGISRRSSVREMVAVRNELVSTLPVVIVLASKNLFTDCFLTEWALMASGLNKMVPVVFGHEDTVTPVWFDKPYRLTRFYAPVRDWARLTQTLSRFTGRSHSYPIPPSPQEIN